MLIEVLLATAVSVSPGAEKGLSAQSQRAVKEAENLSLLKERASACGTLVRAIKRTSAEDSRVLKEKLNQLSRFFYTDKGFQEYLLGKDLFEKQKFSDAVEKLSDADELEGGNIDVLHYLQLSHVWLKQQTLAEAESKRAVQMNPYNIETLKDQVALYITMENWPAAVKAAQSLNTDFSDSSSQSLYWLGLALWQTGDKDSGEKYMTQAITKEPSLPEPYYWLGKEDSDPSNKFITKYIELCGPPPKFVEREPGVCGHLTEAQKVAKSSAPRTSNPAPKSGAL